MPGQSFMIARTNAAALSITCSQLSKTNTSSRKASWAARAATVGREPDKVSPNADAAVAGTSAESRTPERSTVQSPSA
jgi:hypothetical protein